MPNEKEYIEGLIKGSYHDFTCLYELYSSRLYAFIFSLTHAEPLAKDIVQETFIKVWEHRSFLDPEQSFQSYLFTIAKNKLLNEFRKEINRPLPLDKQTDTSINLQVENNAEEKISIDEFNRQLSEAKKQLTPRQRELFELNKERGLSVAEIVEKTSISEQSVRNQLSAAMQILRKEMSQYLSLFFIFF